MWVRGVENKGILVSLRGNQHPWKKLWPLARLLYCNRLERTQIYKVFVGTPSTDPQSRQDVQAGHVPISPVPRQSDAELCLEKLAELPCSSSGLALCQHTCSAKVSLVQEVKPLGSASLCLLVPWCAAPAELWGSCAIFLNWLHNCQHRVRVSFFLQRSYYLLWGPLSAHIQLVCRQKLPAGNEL